MAEFWHPTGPLTSAAKRLSAAERLHAQIDEVFAGSGDLAVAIERVAQLGNWLEAFSRVPLPVER